MSTLDSLIGYPASSYYGPTRGLSPMEGFDCSGFVTFVLNQLSFFDRLVIPYNVRHANEMFDSLGIPIAESIIAPGDLVFFSRNGLAVTHVGFYRGLATNGKRYMIHSPGINGQFVSLKEIIKEKVPRSKPEQLYDWNIAGWKRLTFMNSDPRWKQLPLR